MKIYRIQTGSVKIKKNQLSKAPGITPKMTKVLFDKKWSDWLPVYAWVIEHDEGIFVIDTGETHRTGVKGYLPQWHPYYAMAVKFDVKPSEEIGPQLSKLGINPHKDVKKVIMTHLHTDHAGGLHHFPNAEILVERAEYRAARGATGIMGGYLPHRWPDWLTPRFIEYLDPAFGPFRKSRRLSRDGSIRVVPTPGHVPAHISVIAKKEDIYYFLAGDASYTEQNMLKGIPDGVGTKESTETLWKIREFTRQYPTVYLPSHDPESAARMDNRTIVPLFHTRKLEEQTIM
jgi:glyoxylase-like metal-dependent hydrolase (beta-lactamase superfamily II)